MDMVQPLHQIGFHDTNTGSLASAGPFRIVVLGDQGADLDRDKVGFFGDANRDPCDARTVSAIGECSACRLFRAIDARARRYRLCNAARTERTYMKIISVSRKTRFGNNFLS